MKHTHGPWSFSDRVQSEARLQILKVNIGLEIQFNSRAPAYHACNTGSDTTATKI